MSTVDRIGGRRVVIYPNDHRPAHVHVIGNGCEASLTSIAPKDRGITGELQLSGERAFKD